MKLVPQDLALKNTRYLNLMNQKHLKVGRIGEGLACRFLMKHSFKIIERNYLRKWGEIDIVASKLGILRFVEVKTVTHETDNIVSRETYIAPEEHVTREKLARLARAIQTYLIDKKVPRETKFQLDVVTVKLNLKDKTAKIGMIENVL